MLETDERLLAEAKREASTKRPGAAQPYKAFAALLARYERLIYHVAYRYFNHPEDAQDISQETAVKIYQALPRLEVGADGTLKSWVAAVTANACLDELRKRKSRRETPADNPEGESSAAVSGSPSAEESFMARDRVSELLAAVARLPEDQRTLVILRDMTGLPYQELAEATGVNINTVKSRLSRARAALRSLLSTNYTNHH